MENCAQIIFGLHCYWNHALSIDVIGLSDCKLQAFTKSNFRNNLISQDRTCIVTRCRHPPQVKSHIRDFFIARGIWPVDSTRHWSATSQVCWPSRQIYFKLKSKPRHRPHIIQDHLKACVGHACRLFRSMKMVFDISDRARLPWRFFSVEKSTFRLRLYD